MTGQETATDADLIALDETSQPYVGLWNRLVSMTNWEKGRIILEWREALVAASTPPTEHSDEAWARRVGGVTGQHAGRLRRVYQRFVKVYETYEGLYWSHFQAALDWDDAEMWLEGAVQSKWSVAQMRRTRWETLGQPEELRPNDADVVASELDEDFEPAVNERPARSTVSGEIEEVTGPSPEGPDFGEEEGGPVDAPADSGVSVYSDDADGSVEFVRPFENLTELPDDLSDAFEAYKLTILRHKAEDWQQISRDDLLATLDALKTLALAPSP